MCVVAGCSAIERPVLLQVVVDYKGYGDMEDDEVADEAAGGAAGGAAGTGRA